MYTWQSLLFTSLHQHIHVKIDDLWEEIIYIKILRLFKIFVIRRKAVAVLYSVKYCFLINSIKTLTPNSLMSLYQILTRREKGWGGYKQWKKKKLRYTYNGDGYTYGQKLDRRLRIRSKDCRMRWKGGATEGETERRRKEGVQQLHKAH